MIHTAADSGRANIETLEILREARRRNIDVNARDKSGASAFQLLQRRRDVTQDFHIAFTGLVESLKTPEAVVHDPSNRIDYQAPSQPIDLRYRSQVFLGQWPCIDTYSRLIKL